MSAEAPPVPGAAGAQFTVLAGMLAVQRSCCRVTVGPPGPWGPSGPWGSGAAGLRASVHAAAAASTARAAARAGCHGGRFRILGSRWDEGCAALRRKAGRSREPRSPPAVRTGRHGRRGRHRGTRLRGRVPLGNLGSARASHAARREARRTTETPVAGDGSPSGRGERGAPGSPANSAEDEDSGLSNPAQLLHLFATHAFTSCDRDGEQSTIGGPAAINPPVRAAEAAAGATKSLAGASVRRFRVFGGRAVPASARAPAAGADGGVHPRRRASRGWSRGFGRIE